MMDFTPLPIKTTLSATTVATTATNNGAYMGSIYTADNRVLFIPLASTSLAIFNTSLNIYSSIPGFPGNDAYNGGTLAPDGSVVFIPANTNSIGIFMPSTNYYYTVTPAIATPPFGILSLAGNQYRGGVVLPNKSLLFAPYNSLSIGIFDSSLINNSAANYGFYTINPIYPTLAGNGAFNGCVLIPNGRVIFVPSASTVIGIYDYTQSASVQNNYGYSAVNIKISGNYSGGVLLSDGRVLFIPATATATANSTNSANSASIGIYNPTTKIINKSPVGYSTITPKNPSLNGQFASGVLLPDGSVLFIPFGDTSATSIITIFNPITNTISIVTPSYPMVGNDYYGGTLLKDGRVVCAPYFNRNIGILSGYNTSSHQELCMNPMFNKL